MTRTPRTPIVFVLAGGLAAFAVAAAGSVLLGLLTGIVVLVVGLVLMLFSRGGPRPDGAPDPGRRRFLTAVGLGGLAWAVGGAALGGALRRLGRPDPRPIQLAMGQELGAEYMELVRRAYHPARSGDLQLLLAPFNSSNYAAESLSLVPQDPRTSHASVWMYLQRVPLVVYAPGRVDPSDSVERVTLADLAPTTAELMRFDGYPFDQRAGTILPGITRSATAPKLVVTYVIDGGGWNVLSEFPESWPTMRRVMREGANYRNAIMGSFPAVTACAHATIGTGTFPNQHGITGHNIRDGANVRKAYVEPGRADPADILVPTLADLWSQETRNVGWIGELGYQVWHVGMIGYGGPGRTGSRRPAGVYWNEDGGGGWESLNPELYRVPAGTPTLEELDGLRAGFSDPGWDSQFAPVSSKADCCSPPVIEHQGLLIRDVLVAENVGNHDVTDLLYINFKSPDYAGHVYGMASEWEGLTLGAVDAELAKLLGLLEERLPGEYVLIVTADHGQCPLPDSAGGVRLDPIQLNADLEREFGGLRSAVQEVVPSEVYMHADRLWDSGASLEDVAAFLSDYPYRRNIGPYVPRDAIETNLLDRQQFSAVFATTFLDTLSGRDLEAEFGTTSYPEAEIGLPLPP